MTDQLGGVTTYTYDALGRRKTVTDAESHVTEYFYSAAGSVTKTTVDGHTVSEAEYDALGRTTKAIDGEGNAVTYTYDSVGNVKTYTDALRNVTKYEYNKNYRTVKVTDALGGSTITSYDALGRVTQSTDAEGNATAYTYDANGNVLTVTDALGGTVKYTYDVRGRTATAKDKLGSVTTYTYDAKGNVTATKDAAGRSTRYTYDALGNLTKTTNRMNESVSYTYDAMSRRIKEKNELNQTREYAYDEAGNLVTVTDGNRHVTTYTYDKLSRLVREENAEGGIAEYTYDYLGNISTYTVYGGNNERATTTYTYDAAGNLTKETSPLGYTTTYTYDANGNVTSRTDENGTETTYEYDALGRLTKRSDSDGQVQYTYDKVGNVTSATSDAGTVSFAYDELYRTVKVTNEDGTEISYAYDANGNRLSITYPDGKAVTTAYDELGQVLSLTDHDGTGILYTRDAEGRVTKETYSDGSTTEYTYNAAGLLTLQKEVTKDNETLRQIVYAYDDAGNLTSENRSGVGIERKDELVRYYYDKADQLVKTNIEGVTTSYTYDKAGNLLSDGESTYTYDIQNRLLTKTNADGTTTYSYDKAGNLTREIAPDGITNYTYNAQNKLIKGEKTNGESSKYVYNALGVRIANTQVRTNKNAGNQNADLKDGSHGTDYLRFLTDGRADWQRAWETEIGTTVQNDKETVTRHYTVDYLSIANRDIFVTEDGSYTTRYVYDAGGRRLSAEFDYAEGTRRGEAGENLQSDIAVSIGKVFYRTSILGSTLFAVDKDGNQIAHAIYDPWGKPITETYTDSNYSGLENLNNYTGYTWDITLKLYFAQNRFYDASTHRFTQEDTAKDGTNWYVYCGNEPLLRVDVSGNAPAPKSILVDDGGHSARQVWQQGDSSYPIEAQLMLMVLSWAYYNVDLQLRDSILSAADDVRAAYNKSGSNKKTPIAKALDAQLSNGSLDKTMLYNIFTKNRITITMGNRNDYSTYVMNISLSNPNLVNVKDDDSGRIYSGGNQSWHEDENVNHMGCGSISLTNILLYYMFKMERNTNKTITKSEYLAFYDELRYNYGISILEPVPSVYAQQAGELLSSLGLKAHIRYASLLTNNTKEAIYDVTYAIMTDNPVALQNLVVDNSKNTSAKITPWHWVTITEIQINPFDSISSKVSFSTWGELHNGSKSYRFSDAWQVSASIVFFE